MAELTNLTDRLSHLRDRKQGSGFGEPSGPPPTPPAERAKKARPAGSERRFATDYFMIFVYALLGVALLTQIALILWLELI
jgi:hypothetical protein